MARRIDAHQHFWQLSRGDYGWLKPDFGVLYRDYLPGDLAPLLKRHGTHETVLVQAAPTVAETEYMLQLADEHAFIAGVVGWLDMEADDFRLRLRTLKRHAKLKGIRPMLQDLPDDDWIARPKVRAALDALVEEDLTLDILTFPRHLPHVIGVLRDVPGLRAVVDHISKPPIASGELDPWRDAMSEIAAFPHVMCKVSGLVTEADHANWQPEDIAPFVHHVVDVFGFDRLLFGSDWPVCLLAASYDQVVDVVRTVLKGRLTPEAEAALFGETAARFYRL